MRKNALSLVFFFSVLSLKYTLKETHFRAGGIYLTAVVAVRIAA